MSHAPTVIHKNYLQVLSSHIGKEFTVVNPQSFEETAVGFHLVQSWYPAKLAAVGDDFLVLVGHFQHGGGKHATREPMEQYVPIDRIKRLTIMHSARYLHL